MADVLHRLCSAPGKSGNGCRQNALPDTDPPVCDLHCGDPELASAWGRRMAEKSHAARAERKDADLTELLAACKFDSLESIETYLETMARFALEKSDPRFLNGAARIVETSKWYHEAKGWRDECRAWRKKFGVKRSPIEDAGG